MYVDRVLPRSIVGRRSSSGRSTPGIDFMSEKPETAQHTTKKQRIKQNDTVEAFLSRTEGECVAVVSGRVAHGHARGRPPTHVRS